jgi:hypothetical protein
MVGWGAASDEMERARKWICHGLSWGFIYEFVSKDWRKPLEVPVGIFVPAVIRTKYLPNESCIIWADLRGCRGPVVKCFTSGRWNIKIDSFSTHSRLEVIELRYSQMSYVPPSPTLHCFIERPLFFFSVPLLFAVSSSLFLPFNKTIQCCVCW